MENRKWWIVAIFLLALVVGFAPVVSAQESAAKGTLSGTVLDSTGGSIPGASVTLTGPQGSSTATTNTSGGFTFLDLIPTAYSVKVEMKNFRAAVVPSIEVFTGRNTEIRVTLEPGTVTQTVEVVSSAVTVDTTSTAVASNLNDTFYQKLPVQRGIAGLFYLAPGAVSGGGTGVANPSISGGSGLENMYIADGVSITDTAFGGLGLYNRVYQSVGTGINLAFVKEVQVKTGAFQPQYGGATGGVVQIVTKSGGHDYHGGLSGFWQPQQLEADRLNVDAFGLHNQVGDVIHVANMDFSGEFGGSIPGMRDKLFFFGSADPTRNSTYQLAPPTVGLFSNGELTGETWVYNYAGKLTYKISDKHSIEGSVFGDPSYSNTFPWVRLTEGVKGIPNNSNFSKLTYGNRDVVARYNGTLSPTWVLNASVAWQHNKFTEGGYNLALSEVIDQTQLNGGPHQAGQFIPEGRGFVENTRDESYSYNINTTKILNFWGQHAVDVGFQYVRGYYDGGRSYSGPAIAPPTTNIADNPLSGASAWAGKLANYEWRLLPAPASCTLCPLMTVPDKGPGNTPAAIPVYLRMYRSEFKLTPDGFKHFVTHSVYHVGYANDAWTLNKYVTINAGLRWQQERMVGEVTHYTFVDDWSPRLGVDVDPVGDRKNKIFFNFGRYSYNLPLDLAERSLTDEQDLGGLRLAPVYTIIGGKRIVTLNQFGSVTPMIDAAHTLNQAAGGFPTSKVITASGGGLENINHGTKSTYEDEYVFGGEHEFPHGILASARYIHRSLRRIVEDTAGISPEAAQAGIAQTYLITNPGSSTDIFVNPINHNFVATLDANGFVNNVPAACGGGDFVAFPITNSFGAPITDSQGNTASCFTEANPVPNDLGPTPIGVGGCQLDAKGNSVPGKCIAAGTPVPDGVPDGFSDPIRKYWAVEFEVNKSFSHNWQLRANYRIAKLFGNYEGAFRNDNGQSDPGISSLFDFTPGTFNQLGEQFAAGILNTDRQQVVNGYFSYVFDRGMLKNLTLGTGVRVQTGTPISELAAHPSPLYGNPGEVPIGGRGSQGRTPTTGSVDFHGDYVLNVTEKAKLRFGVDMFNLANTKRILYINQNIDLGLGTTNLDFLKPNNQAVRGDGIQSPFNARVFFRFEF